MRRRLIVATAALLLLAIAGLGLLAGWLVNTEAGLAFVLARLRALGNVSIVAEGVRGTIAGPLAFDSLVIDHEAVRIEARAVSLEPALANLISRTILLHRAEFGAITVILKDHAPKPPSEPHFLPHFLEVEVDSLAARNIVLVLKTGQRFALAEARGRVLLTRRVLTLPAFSIVDSDGRLTGEAELRAARPMKLTGGVAGHWRLPDGHEYEFSGAVRGDFDRLGTDVNLTQPARLAFGGNALTLTEHPRLVGTIRAVDFDGSPWVPAGRFPRISGSIAIDAARESIGIDGTFTSPAIGAEPLRVQGGGRFRQKMIELSSLRAWLPRSGRSVTGFGTIELGHESPVLDLTGEWTALQWPLTGEPLVESALGAYHLTGGLPYAFTVKAETRGPQIPATAFEATGSFDRERLTVDSIDAYALRGQVRGAGQLAWVGEREWRFTVDGRSLDLRELRPDLDSRINVTGSIEGRGFSADGPWTARVATLSGTLLGRALAGSGEVTRRDGWLDFRRIRVTNADSYVRLDGRVGETLDVSWEADLRTLTLVDPSLDGRLIANGRAQGRRERPELVASARLTALRRGDIVIESADAEVDVDLSDSRASKVDLFARNLTTGPLTIDRLHVIAQGRAGDHTLDLELVSPGTEDGRIAGFLARVGAQGAADVERRAWRGKLTTAEIVYPDGSATLLQPAEIEASPQAARAAPICIETGEARLCAEGNWNAAPAASWRLIYSVQDWPLKRLLTSVLGWREFDGMLQGGGWLGQEPGQDWMGGTTLLLDQTTLDIPRNKFRSERVRIGGGRLDLFAEADQIRASVALDVAESTRLHGTAVATRERGAAMRSYPVTGRIHGESSVLTALPLLVPEIDRSSGSMAAELGISGTLGEPRFDGEFGVHDGRFEFYRTNLVLSDTELTGRFAGDELTFSGRSRTAKGPVTLDGRFTWPGGVMTGSMRLRGEELLVADTPEYRIVASPDVTVNAGTEGYRVTGEVRIPSARIAPKDLSTSVSTSPDERIVGIDDGDASPSTLERVRSRVDLVLGDDVRVDSHGLRARLGGAVTVMTAPGDVARGLGAINILDGEYRAFGQFVRITRGRLSYNNTPLSEPILDLVAERRIEDEDVTVAVNVRGPLVSPFVSLTATPAMSSNEALSYLLTGRSIDTLQSGEVQALGSAAESLAISGGGLLLGGIGSRLGLDEVSVERTGVDDTAVVLGKHLSSRLFVSYGISIVEAINTIKLRYTLNSKWSLRAEAGLEQAADIEYRIER